ncbi:hypothetical protein PENSPDRAFT_750542 [Peniophora sp. CONT]|nr:hypothetical protein PENSPDRAFT_750542 [Peniophora sp. CONT]
MSSVRPGARPMGLPSNPRAAGSISRPASRAGTDTSSRPGSRAGYSNDQSRSASRAGYAGSSYSTVSEPRRRATGGEPAPPLREVRTQRSIANIAPRAQSSTRAPRDPMPPRPSLDDRSRTYDDRPRERSRSRVREVPRERERVPEMPRPSERTAQQSERPRLRGLRNETPVRSRAPSASTASSPISDAPSSFFGRSETSSRSSLEDNNNNKPMGREDGRRGDMPGWVGNHDDYRLDDENYSNEQQQQSTQTGLGTSLWARVSEAAGTLTVTVSQAWAGNVQTYSGERTPPGQESSLSRALKAYHMDKARAPEDLPEWLFSAQERGQRSRPSASATANTKSSSRDRDDDYGQYEPPRTARPPPSAYVSQSSVSSSRSPSFDLDRTPTTKASNRLRELRDAKRSQAIMRANSSDPVTSERVEPRMVRDDEGRYEPPMPRAPPRSVGLPSRPGARRI